QTKHAFFLTLQVRGYFFVRAFPSYPALLIPATPASPCGLLRALRLRNRLGWTGNGGRVALRWHPLIELQDDAVRVADKRTPHGTGSRLRQAVRGRRQRHPFAHQLLTDSVQPRDPKPNMCDTDLINLDAGAGGRGTERGNQGDNRGILTQDVHPSTRLARTQNCKPKRAVRLLEEPALVL